MAKDYSNEKLLQVAETLFETLKTREEIANELAEYTYDTPKIAEGKTLYDKAKTQQDINRKETKEEIQAYEVFEKSFKGLVETYKAHRKRAKIVFKDQDSILKILALKGAMATRILSLLEAIEIFYTELDKEQTYKTAVQKMKITQENITAQLTALTETKTAYAKYHTEKGESQQATKDKDKAFADLEKWVREFYSVAKIDFEDKPQLLESLEKAVKS